MRIAYSEIIIILFGTDWDQDKVTDNVSNKWKQGLRIKSWIKWNTFYLETSNWNIASYKRILQIINSIKRKH